MSVLTQPPTMGDVLKYELNPNFTRETVTLLAGANYPVGAVLGRITASGKMKLSTATGSDGAQNAAAVLLYDVDATAADATGIVVLRGPAIVSKAGLVFDASVDDAAKTAAKHAQLTALGIIPRDAA
ncbi:head decoration protein [Thalassobacter stenotrophicus]|uniref:head decoration protein n=1 Tax=Thalassobacter stenotrophicus TaxID=266809 RepID=UPI000D5F41CC|nr:head decoration protein [Thalassobacter stenotrophicus]PVZ48639.1 head decoration protein [Thalassobacter stenotrophicus]